ncbi:hypothetical protein NKH77_35435 [Streptomyces sp. M19]
MHTLQRRALRATNKVGWELQNLRDQLTEADRHRQQAEVRAEALTEALLVRKHRIAEMEAEQRRHAVSEAAERAAREGELTRSYEEREQLRAERDRLREEVALLQAELDRERQRALDAERRCTALENQLETAEEAAAEDGDDGSPAAELERLRAELDALRRQNTRPRTAHRDVCVTYAPRDRDWAEWVERVLTGQGHRVALRALSPTRHRLRPAPTSW